MNYGTTTMYSSPELEHAYLNNFQAKFNAGRAFEFEDDIEFCPVITEQEISLHHSYRMASYYSSPNTTPPHNGGYDATDAYLGSPVPRRSTAQPLQIVDPVTGGRVASPSYYYSQPGWY